MPGTRLYAAVDSPSFFTMEACFWPERWMLKTVWLLQTTLHIVQALTAPAAAPPSTIFCFFMSRSFCCVCNWAGLFPGSTAADDLHLLASSLSIGPIIGFVVTCAAVEAEVLVSFFGSASFSKFFRCFFPSMCLVKTSLLLQLILQTSHHADWTNLGFFGALLHMPLLWGWTTKCWGLKPTYMVIKNKSVKWNFLREFFTYVKMGVPFPSKGYISKKNYYYWLGL